MVTELNNKCRDILHRSDIFIMKHKRYLLQITNNYYSPFKLNKIIFVIFFLQKQYFISYVNGKMGLGDINI